MARGRWILGSRVGISLILSTASCTRSAEDSGPVESLTSVTVGLSRYGLTVWLCSCLTVLAVRLSRYDLIVWLHIGCTISDQYLLAVRRQSHGRGPTVSKHHIHTSATTHLSNMWCARADSTHMYWRFTLSEIQSMSTAVIGYMCRLHTAEGRCYIGQQCTEPLRISVALYQCLPTVTLHSRITIFTELLCYIWLV